jgi:AhpC/TSA antioxidant enzyme
VLIGQATPADAASFRRQFEIELPVLADERRTSYKAVGAKMSGVNGLLGPKVVLKGIKTSLGRRVMQGKTVGHPAQLGASLVIAPGGEVLFKQLANDASDNAPARADARCAPSASIALIAGAAQQHFVALDAHPQAVRQPVDRALEPGVVEGDELAASLADEMMVMVLASRMGGLIASDPVTEVKAVDKVVGVKQLEDAVDARPPDRPLAAPAAPQSVLDLQRAQRARLSGQQVDQPVAGRATVMPRAPQHASCVLRPIGTGVHQSLVGQVTKHSRHSGRKSE